MFVSGFTFIRNAVKYDYPIQEAILSILPLCDELVVAVGKSEDETLEIIKSLAPDKIKIIETEWDDSLREGGRVLADETMKAYNAISGKSDWCFYIQGDEVIHEKYHDSIRKSMEEWKDDSRVEGLLFDYKHFYGSYDYIGSTRRWYRREVRIVRKSKEIYSFRDAQGFQSKGRPLKVKFANATVHHYGWVKDPRAQQAKQQSFNKLWHDDQWMKKNVADVESFDYSNIDALIKYEGTHPKVMQKRVDALNWKFSFDPTTDNRSFKTKVLSFVEKHTGWSIGEYQNYRII